MLSSGIQMRQLTNEDKYSAIQNQSQTIVPILTNRHRSEGFQQLGKLAGDSQI